MQTVYVGLSGGVDSSVTAALLKQRGFRVVGVYMKNWTQNIGGVDCPWKEDLADAKAVAVTLDIPFKVFDFEAQYRQKVVDAMVAEYRAGRTPNPDVLCNQEIKFKLFLDAALADGADLIATGHYARILDGRLYAGVDSNKDQSYFLYRITPGALLRALMPIGNYEKPRVRELARQYGLPTAAKKDSQGICFVGEVGMKAFLEQYLPQQDGAVINHATGARLGRHDGATFYTIGQRHGLGIGGGTPYYVVNKDMATNTVMVTDDPADLELQSDRFTIGNCHWISAPPQAGKQYQVRSRYRAELIACTLEPVADGYEVHMAKAERAISVGQSAVVYQGSEVLGGGIITAGPHLE